MEQPAPFETVNCAVLLKRFLVLLDHLFAVLVLAKENQIAPVRRSGAAYIIHRTGYCNWTICDYQGFLDSDGSE